MLHAQIVRKDTSDLEKASGAFPLQRKWKENSSNTENDAGKMIISSKSCTDGGPCHHRDVSVARATKAREAENVMISEGVLKDRVGPRVMAL